ncbi:hypothetical protein [Natronocalculus amylovorans]|uniref:DUF2357 domain-containing protein n=1 Tax=Natronocalculus amylovorans TaxID=2917812 RepID=A0AAE3FZP4_9EURY|nr:hypothetical protein [Natronocalculus amylovorans]MCL9818393.1 hypothetical protein [Natronocalculus amylovorans]
MATDPRKSELNDARTPADTLVREVASSFSVYLGRGIQLDPILEDIDPTLNIESLDELLDIHFLLSGRKLSSEAERRPPNLNVDVPVTMDIGVMDFMSLLQRRLRRLHTTTERETRVFEGELRGRIDWQETIKTRYRTGNSDELTFACQLTEETIKMPKNLVLWELLTTIRDSHSRALDLIENESEAKWFDPWQGETGLRSNLDAGLTDVHLSELENVEVQVSDRMVRTVSEARSPLYREAANLLAWYRQLKRYDIDPKEAQALLGRQLFYPDPEREDYDEVPTIFELYWVFKLLEAYDNPRLQLITGPTDLVAAWRESETQYELYHNWTGGDLLTFKPPIFDREELADTGNGDRYLRRLDYLLTHQMESTSAIFGHSRPSNPSELRPDFALLRRNTETKAIERIAIGEVKYTRRPPTAADGLEELLKYMIYARKTRSENESENSYFTNSPDHFDTRNIHGFLCLDQVPHSAVGYPSVDILEFGDNFQRPF